ncbi:MAG: hydantoinase/oxoprolinase family protein [Promethearchaeota archaeon]
MHEHGLDKEPVRIGIDVGGTFTDVLLIDSKGTRWHVKVRSTPKDSSIGVLEGIQKALEQSKIPAEKIQYLLHGTTVATNTVLQRKGSTISLITTKGFEDLLKIGRQQRSTLYDLYVDRVHPLVSRDKIIGVDERICFDGEVLNPLTEKEVKIAVKKAALNSDAVAICLLFSFQNPQHEEELAEELRQQDSLIPISVSSTILPEYREYERMSTTVLNAYVTPVLTNYLQRLVLALQEIGLMTPLLVMQSHGGVLQSHLAEDQAARLLFSGLAGGTLGGRYTSQVTKHENVITFDMGGTSTDVALISQGTIRETTEGHIDELPCRLPMVDVETVGAGGGSIGWIDAGGILRVGPQSAGAEPGPAAYGLGGVEPTVTDANLILGRLNPNYFLGGTMALDTKLASQSIQGLAKPLSLSLEECAYGVIRVVNANMERAIRVISIQRGYDPRDFALVAFGGAGPMHAWALAKNLGIPRVIIPNAPGLHSALGLLTTNLRTDQSHTILESTQTPNLSRINSIFLQLEHELKDRLSAQGITQKAMKLQRLADLRYSGQAYEITLPVPKGRISRKWMTQLEQGFHTQHQTQYGFAAPNAKVTIVNLRVIAQGPMPKLKAVQLSKQKGTPKVRLKRQVFFEELNHSTLTPIYERSSLGSGAFIEGPAIIEQLDSTTVIHPDTSASVQQGGNIVLEGIQ